MTGVREGQRYFVVVSGATSAVSIEFQHEVGGQWYTHPEFNGSPSNGVVADDISCAVPRMRIKLASSQETPWVATWVKQAFQNF